LKQHRNRSQIKVEREPKEGIRLYGKGQPSTRRRTYLLQLEAMLDSAGYQQVVNSTFLEHNAFYLNDTLVNENYFLAFGHNLQREAVASYGDLLYMQFEKVVVVNSSLNSLYWVFGRIHVPKLEDPLLDLWTLSPTSTSSLLPLHWGGYQLVFLASCVTRGHKVFLNTRIQEFVSLGVQEQNTSHLVLVS